MHLALYFHITSRFIVTFAYQLCLKQSSLPTHLLADTFIGLYHPKCHMQKVCKSDPAENGTSDTTSSFLIPEKTLVKCHVGVALDTIISH